MERRASKRTESLRTSQKLERFYVGTYMDPKLWSNLSRELLMLIYISLPIPEFYKFRIVCKDWNAVALSRRSFTDLVPKPYFILTQQGSQCNATGMLAYSIRSGRWVWKHMTNHFKHANIGHLYEQFDVDGILFSASDLCHHEYLGYYHTSHHQADWCEYSILDKPRNLLFDVEEHKSINGYRILCRGERKIHPPSIVLPRSILGMMVDRSNKSYKLILGNSERETLILDSTTNRWMARESRMIRSRDPVTSVLPKSCVQFGGRMYVWVEADEIQVYDLARDEWSVLDKPPRHDGDEECRGLGHWKGNLYAVTKNPHGTLSIWKLDVDDVKWTMYNQIPMEFYNYLMQPDCVPPLVAVHCNEYLLISVSTKNPHVRYTMLPKLGRRIIIFNIINKRWEIAHVPLAQMWRPQKSTLRYYYEQYAHS